MKKINTKYQWKLKERLLGKEENVEKIKEETMVYFELNLGKDYEFKKNKEKKNGRHTKKIKERELDLVKNAKT